MNIKKEAQESSHSHLGILADTVTNFRSRAESSPDGFSVDGNFFLLDITLEAMEDPTKITGITKVLNEMLGGRIEWVRDFLLFYNQCTSEGRRELLRCIFSDTGEVKLPEQDTRRLIEWRMQKLRTQVDGALSETAEKSLSTYRVAALLRPTDGLIH